MSHGMIEGLDYQHGLTVAWHGLTEVKETLSGFPIEAEYTRQEIPFMGKPSGFDFITSGGNIVGKPIADSFQFLSNAQVFDLVHDSLTKAGVRFQVESLGTYGARARRYISVRLSEFSKSTVGGRDFNLFLSVMDALDGSMSLQVRANSICVVCQNTFGFSLKDKGEFSMGVKHTKAHEVKAESAGRIIEAFAASKKSFEKWLSAAHETPCNATQARNVFAGFASGNEPKELSARALGTVDRMGELFLRGKGNQGETFLDAFSAVTDYYTHESSGGRGISQQVESSETGTAKEKKEAFASLFMGRLPNGETFLDRKAIARVANVGELALALN